MNVDLTKIFGWVLLVGGVGIIVWTLYSSYNIFTGKTALPEFFEIGAKEAIAPAAPKGKTSTSPEEIQEQLGEMVSEQLKGILPVDLLPKILNLFVWSMLAGILIFGGSQIAGLGIKLIKK